MENTETKDINKKHLIIKKNYIFEIVFIVLILCEIYILFISNINKEVVSSFSFFISLVLIALGWFGISNKKNKYFSYAAIFFGSLPILFVVIILLILPFMILFSFGIR